jgi:hypothetical protein
MVVTVPGLVVMRLCCSVSHLFALAARGRARQTLAVWFVWRFVVTCKPTHDVWLEMTWVEWCGWSGVILWFVSSSTFYFNIEDMQIACF